MSAWFTPINSEEDYNQLGIYAYVCPVIGCWHRAWSVYAYFQNYKSPCADGSVKALDRPYFNFSWQNDIELPKGWRLSANFTGCPKGEMNNFSVERARFRADFGVQRDISLRRVGQLNLAWKLNEAGSKYRGSGAGEKLKARM